MLDAIIPSYILVTIALMWGAYALGRARGFKRGMRLANANNKAIIDKLKQANAFATELRQHEHQDKTPHT